MSLQIGGNDIGFTEILTNCVTANPFTRPCQDKYVRGGVDELRNRIAATAPKVAAVLDAIRAKTAARIVVLNYEAILPASGSGCWPQVPLAWADVPYVRGNQNELNAMLATVAARDERHARRRLHGEIGKDACRSSGTRWVEPLVPGNAAAPFHPNARGMAGVAGGRRRGSLAALRLDAAARTSLRANFAPSASQRTQLWPSAVQTRPKCIGLPPTVPLLRISHVPSARLE